MRVWKDVFTAECRALKDDIRCDLSLQPTSRKFVLTAWQARFSTAKESDTWRLLKFGEDIHSSLAHVRGELRVLEQRLPGTINRAHLVLLYANAFTLSIEEGEGVRPDQDGHFVPDFIAAATIDLPMNLRSTMVSFVETVYDSIRFPVPHFARSDRGSPCPSNPSQAAMEWAQKVFELAALYASYEYLWGRALWADAAIRETQAGWKLSPSQPTIEESIAAAKHLGEVDKVQTPMELISDWLMISEAERLARVPPAAEISIRKGRLTAHWNWQRRDIAHPPMELVALHLTANRLPLSLVNIVQPCEGCSVTDVLRLRELLSQIGQGLVDAMRGAHPSTVQRYLSATFTRGALIETLCIAMHMSKERVAAMVTLFTLSDARSEFWYQPLIDLGADRLGFALHPLRYASSIRTLEWLLSRDRHREGDKGRAFEDGVGAFLEWAASHNNVVHPQIFYRLSTSNEVGDIDLLCVYGDMLLVIECKCPSQPASDNDFFNREKALRQASRQASRKAGFVCANVKAFLARHKIDAAQVRAVLPLVLVSGNEHVGCSLDGAVAIVSKNAISLAFANRSNTMFLLGPDGSRQSLIKESQRPNTLEEAVTTLLNDINTPPLLELYAPYVKRQVAKYEMVHSSKQIELDYFSVVFDENDQRKFAAALGIEPMQKGKRGQVHLPEEGGLPLTKRGQVHLTEEGHEKGVRFI